MVDELMTIIDNGGFRVYFVIFLLAFFETSLLTAHLIPGIFAIIFMGVAVESGLLPAVPTLASCWAGSITAGNVNFFVIRFFGKRLGRWKWFGKFSARASSLMKGKGFLYIVPCHFSPFTRSFSGAAGAVAGMRYPLWASTDGLAALGGLSFFMGLGYFGSRFLGGIEISDLADIAQVGGILVITVALSVAARSAVAAKTAQVSACPFRTRGWKFCARVIPAFLFHFWPRGVIERRVYRHKRSPETLLILLKCLQTEAQVGDAILLARPYLSPYGKFTHTCIVTKEGPDGMVSHATDRGVCEESFLSLLLHCFPPCIELVIVRPRASTEQRVAVVEEARKHLGMPFFLPGRIRVKGKNPRAFNCSGFTCFVYEKAGIVIAESSGWWPTPQDVFDSPNCDFVARAQIKPWGKPCRRCFGTGN